MNRRSLSLRPEILIYVVLLAGAALLRCARLDWPPLDDAEAGHALAAAAQVARRGMRAGLKAVYRLRPPTTLTAPSRDRSGKRCQRGIVQPAGSPSS
jgi:hypothetical protein